VNVWDERFERLLRQYLNHLAPSEPLQPGDDMRSLGLDSMAAVRLLMAVEEEFGVLFPNSVLSADTMATPNSLWLALSQLTQVG
jgi:acyl carrier protein